jgi:hypothetical protein
MRILQTKMNFGTEMVLRYNDLFTQILNTRGVDKIMCSISKDMIKSLKSEYGEDYYKDCLEVCKFVFTDDRIEVTEDQTYQHIDFNLLKHSFNIRETFDLNDKIISEDFDNEEPYITITTKIQIFPTRDHYEQVKTKLFDVLNKSKYRIIILGEREISKSAESDIHKPYTIYKDLIENLKNYKDCTFASSHKKSDLIPLKQTFNILNKSRLNIYLGWAGIKSISLYTSDNIIAISEYNNAHISNRKNKENIHLYQNFDDFINRLNIFFDSNER